MAPSRSSRRESFRGGIPAPQTPTRRRLRVYAFDPGLSTQLETWRLNHVTLSIPWEPLGLGKLPGPRGDYLEVVDIDPASGRTYPHVNLDDPALLATDGLAPSEIRPEFHQQMVYAVAMNTITHFERALGRTAMWNPRWVDGQKGSKPRLEYVHRLRIYPHAMREANAYYSPDKKALLFGYFKSVDDGVGLTMPGATIFTCLSHDIIAHEITHALLDGLHPHFTDPSNPDVLAFHEAFADIVALFSRFSMTDIVRAELARAKGQLDAENMLGSMAMQFGAAIGSRSALRDAIGQVVDGKWTRRKPDPSKIKTTMEPHSRGAILVAAIFDAFLGIYRNRSRDLIRIATGGTGVLPQGDLHPDLVDRLTREASTSAKHMLTMCIRALDYCPPVDITFGDYLRALITADADLVPDDDKSYRVAVIDGFRRHGIYPGGVNSMSEEALLWEPPLFSDELEDRIIGAIEKAEAEVQQTTPPGRSPRQGSLHIDREDPLTTPRGLSYQRMDRACTLIRKELLRNITAKDEALQWQLGICVGAGSPGSVQSTEAGKPNFQVNRLRHARRVGPEGVEVTDHVLELTQRRHGYHDPDTQKAVDDGAPRPTSGYDFLVRGGCTLNIDMRARRIRYCVAKNVMSERRLSQQREYLSQSAPGMALYGKSDEMFALLHRC
jgi:hypothetical protein